MPATCSSKATKSRIVGGASGGSSRTASSGTAGSPSARRPAAKAAGSPARTRSSTPSFGGSGCIPASLTTPARARGMAAAAAMPEGCVKVAKRMRPPSDRRCAEHAAVGIVERLGGDQLVHLVGGAPLVRDVRLGEVVQVRVPGVLVDLLELRGVLDGVPVRVEEVAEGVVACQVPSRSPDLLHPCAEQPAGAAHVLVDAAKLERGVVQ